jgi:hypothetical protein
VRNRLITASIAAAAVTAAVSTWRLPDLIHAFRGDTRTVAGRASIDLGVTSDQRKQEGGANVSAGNVKFYVPIVPDGWNRDQPVHVILQTHYWGFDELHQRTSHTGVARDVLWEGLDGDVRSYFAEKIYLRLADDLVLLEDDATPPSLKTCLILGAIVFGLVFLLTLAGTRKKAAA